MGGDSSQVQEQLMKLGSSGSFSCFLFVWVKWVFFFGMLWWYDVDDVVVVGGGNKDWEPVEIISFYKVFSV